MLTMIYENLQATISLHLDLELPLVKEGGRSDDQICFAAGIFRLIFDNECHPGGKVRQGARDK